MHRALKLSDGQWDICYISADDLSNKVFQRSWTIYYTNAKYLISVAAKPTGYKDHDNRCKTIAGLKRCLPYAQWTSNTIPYIIVSKYIDGQLVDIHHDDVVIQSVDPKSPELMAWLQSFGLG